MNAERLKAVVESLLQAESNSRIQKRLTAVNSSITSLVGEPANVEHQTALANNIQTLDAALSSFWTSLAPPQKNDIISIKAYPYFSLSIIDEINASIQKNAMTPVIVQNRIKQLTESRQSYLDTLNSTNRDLETLGVKAITLEPGESELGVLLPAELYEHDLSGFQRELKTLVFILRSFYEASNLTPGPITLRQISMSDPILFLGIDVSALIQFGHAVKWCIDTVKAAIEIKNIVGLARKTAIATSKIDALDSEAVELIDRRIVEKSKEMLENYTGDAARKNEVEQALNTSLRLLLERVERGVTVEIRLLPPSPNSDEQPAPAQQHQFAELVQIAKELEFPKITDHPALQLTTEVPSPQAGMATQSSGPV